MTWFARVPTEADIADYPSRFQKLDLRFSQMISAAIVVLFEFSLLWWRLSNLGSNIAFGGDVMWLPPCFKKERRKCIAVAST